MLRLAGGIAVLAVLAVGCGGGSGPTGPGADGGPIGGSTQDIGYIRQSRGIQTTEPEGLRNLEVRVGSNRTPVTQSTAIDGSICQVRCLLTPDKRHLLAVSGTNLISMPVSNLQADPGNLVQINEDGKALVSPNFKLIPPGDQVLFIQQESDTPTYSLASAPVTGGNVVKYRTGSFPPSSGFNATEDGETVLFGEVLGAASQLNIWMFAAGTDGSGTAAPIFRLTTEGSAIYGSELLEMSPNGNEVMIATQTSGDRVLIKVATNGSTTTPPQLRLGPRECAAAGDNDICEFQSKLYYSPDGSKIYFLGARQSGIDLLSQLYSVSSGLSSPPQKLSSFTTEIQSLALNRARNRVVFATEAGAFNTTNTKRNNAIFSMPFDGSVLSGTPEKIVDDSTISFNYQEAYFLE